MYDTIVRCLVVMVLVGCWSGSPPPPVSNTSEQRPVLAVGPESPGYLYIEGGSKTFERAIKLAEKGDALSAIIELTKVVAAETGDNADVRLVAEYNLATLWLELGFYTQAAASYEMMTERTMKPEVAVRVATGIGVLHHQLGEHTTLRPDVRPLDHVLPQVPVRVQPVLKRLHDRRELRPTSLAIATDLARVNAELVQLQHLDKAFQTTMAAATLIQELTVHQSVLAADCEKVACARVEWRAPPAVRPAGLHTLSL